MEAQPIAGALMVYCGGCMLSVRERLDEVIGGVSQALDSAPFLGTFTFGDRKSTRLNSSHLVISYAVFCLKKKKNKNSNKHDLN